MPSLAMATTRNVGWGGDPYGEGKVGCRTAAAKQGKAVSGPAVVLLGGVV